MECEHCSRTHRTEVSAEKCRARAERAALVQEKRDKEAERRRLNAESVPFDLRIRQMRREGQRWDQIASEFKKNYPKGTPTDLWTIALSYASGLNWPIPDEFVARSLLEKFYVGEYISFHPMQMVEVQQSLLAHGAYIPQATKTIEETEDKE